MAFAFLCFYACCYPICALLFLNQNSTNVGSLGLQAFQGMAVLALAPFWKVRSKIQALNVWFVSIVYFSLISLYFALFRAFDESVVEITYALRFIFWLMFAFVLESDSFSARRIRTLVLYFAIGATIQCLIAVVCYVFNLGGGSIYSDINASVGSKYVSGKTIVSFVTLEIILAFYWYSRVKWYSGVKTRRVHFLLILLLGVLVLLFSFNRAGQLSLLVAMLWSLTWLIRRKRMKLLLVSFFVFLLAGVWLSSGSGGVFLERWRQLNHDRGSGRVEILQTAVSNVMDPRSPEALLIGRGYHKTKNLMNGVFGIRIGTHSDLLDFATSYGLVGLFFYVLIIVKFFALSKKIPYDTLERLCCRASTAAFVVMSLTTGVFQGTYAVLMFLFFARYYQIEAEDMIAIRNRRAFEAARAMASVARKARGGPNDDALELLEGEVEFSQNELEGGESEETTSGDSNALDEDQDAGEIVEKTETDDSIYDPDTTRWLQELEVIYADVGEIDGIFAGNAGTEVQNAQNEQSVQGERNGQNESNERG